MKKLLYLLIIGPLLISACQQNQDSVNTSSSTTERTNPAAPDFNTEESDAKAIAVADSVMQAMGGRKNWDQTKIIQWNFFGRRIHTWNKHSDRDSIHIPGKNLVIDMNIRSKKGEVFKNENKLTQPDSVQKYLQQGYQMWVNDSYWLIMPYKLKDSGVTLNYLGMDSTQTGQPAHKLKLTFDSVGVTPENMYHVYVDSSDYRVQQWAYFADSTMDEPQFVLPWNNYQQYGNIMLSGDRGSYKISDIKVMDEWPDEE